MAFDVRDLVDEGSSAAVYRLPEKQVLKLFRDSMAEELVRYEYDAARFAHDSGIFVGRPVEMRRFDDRWGIIFEDLERPTLRVELNRKPLRQLASLRHWPSGTHKSTNTPAKTISFSNATRCFDASSPRMSRTH